MFLYGIFYLYSHMVIAFVYRIYPTFLASITWMSCLFFIYTENSSDPKHLDKTTSMTEGFAIGMCIDDSN